MSGDYYRFDWKADLIWHLKRGPVITSFRSLRRVFTIGTVRNALSQAILKDVQIHPLDNDKVEIYW